MLRLKAWRIITLVFCLIYPGLAAAQYCLDDWACWEVRVTGSNYEFWVTNLKAFPFTGTLDVKTKNLRSDTEDGNRYSRTSVVEGHSEQRVMTLYPVKKSKRVSYEDVFYWSPGRMDAEHDDSVIYQLPFAEDKQYPVVQGFGGRWSHSGGSRYAVDFAMPVGTEVHAARAGVVVQTVDHHNRGGPSRRYVQFANYIVVLHKDGTTGEYHHLMHRGVDVEEGAVVAAGDLLGYSGNTGFSSLPHLHFAVYRPKAFGDFESVPFQFEKRRP